MINQIFVPSVCYPNTFPASHLLYPYAASWCLPKIMTFHQDISLPGLGVLLIHPLFGLLKKAHGLLSLVGQVLHDHAKILILAKDLYFALISGQNGAEVLVGIRQQVQDVGRAVFQCHLRVLAQTYHLNRKHKRPKMVLKDRLIIFQLIHLSFQLS